MIIFDLGCENEHRFEGWFRHADEFKSQLERDMIACPQCGSAAVRRLPSAVAIGTGGGTSVSESTSVDPVAQPSPTTFLSSDTQMKGLYRQLLNTLLANSENVGTGFAEEARKIHYQEAPERSIHGQSTPAEREALQEEGIMVISLPTIGEEDLN